MLLDCREKGIFLEKKEIDNDDVDGKVLEVDIAEIVRVFFCGDQGRCASLMRRLEQLNGFGSGISMMVGEGSLSGDRESPVFKVSDEGAGITNSAESVERAGTEFGDGEESRRRGGKSAKTKQARLRGENRATLKFANCRSSAGIGFRASENE